MSEVDVDYDVMHAIFNQQNKLIIAFKLYLVYYYLFRTEIFKNTLYLHTFSTIC